MGTRNFRNYPAIVEVGDYHSIPSYKIPEIGVKCKEICPENFGYEFHGTCGLMYYGLIYRSYLPDRKVIAKLLEKKLKKTMWRKEDGRTAS